LTALLVLLYFALVVVFSLPDIKVWIGEKTAVALSEKIGSEVHIGDVDIDLPGSAKVNNVVIYDQHEKKMIVADRADVTIEIIPLFSGEVNITNLKLLKSDIILYKETPDSKPNYQFMLDSLASKPDNESGFKVNLRSILCRDVNVRYDVLNVPVSEGLIDVNHLDVQNFNASLVLKDITKEKFELKIRNLAFLLHNSGEVKNAQANIKALDGGNRYSIDLKELELIAHKPDIDLKLNDSKFIVKTDRKYDNQIEQIDIADAKCAANISGRQYNADILIKNNFENQTRPIVASVDVRSNNVKILKSQIVSSYYPLKSSKIDFESHITNDDIDVLSKYVGNSKQFADLLRIAGFIEQEGHLDIHNSKILFSGNTRSSICDIAEDVEVYGKTADYLLSIKNLQLPQSVTEDKTIAFYDTKLSGSASFKNHDFCKLADIAGTQILRELSATADANIGKLEYDSKNISSVSVKANYINDCLSANFSIKDPKANLDG